MRKLATVTVLAATGIISALAAQAAPPRVVVRGPRAAVVVRPGFPLHRTLPHVVVRAPRVTVRVAPAAFLPPVVWAPGVVVLPGPDRIVREDSESLDREDGWTDFTLNIDDRGRKLFLQVVDGRARINFAEVVFENGDAQVVDFGEKPVKPGVYSLLDFADGRKVDHVRMVAAAVTDSVKVVVKMEK